MYLEEKIDLMLAEQKRLSEMVELFLPDLQTEKGVVHFLEITKNTFNSYLSNGTFVEGVHYRNKGRRRIFISDEIVNLKKNGIKGRHKSFSKQDKIDSVNKHLGIISTCRHAG